MTLAQANESTLQNRLRLWPGVVAVTLQWMLRFVAPIVWPDALAVAVIGGLVGGLIVLAWWAFFSRAPGIERWGAIVLIVAGLAATRGIVHPSIADGMMGMMLFIYAIPVLSFALVAWAVASRGLGDGPRRATMVATILLACGGWALLRTNGISGDAVSDFAWRWADTAEDRLLQAQAGDRPVVVAPPPPVAPVVKAPAAEPVVTAKVVDRATTPVLPPPIPAAVAKIPGADWPGFRGPNRDGVLPGVRIETNWAASPPVQMWRQPIGPGWSSFAVQGDMFYTQEQRGEDEIVACYNMNTGKLVWRHSDAARFWESNAGAGPRATPTLSNGRVYTFGGTGIVNALDARDGAVVWSRNAASDTGMKVPGWGFASSPLVVGDLVIVAAAGKMVAYNLATGEPRWLGPGGGQEYSSPHPVTIGGVPQILLLSGGGVTSVTASDGKQIWQHPLPPGVRIVQPALTAEGDVLISEGGGSNLHRIAVKQGPAGWAVEERWSSAGLKPYFSDLVVHNGHAFGFDGSILSCIDLKDGKRTWKGGRYGHGQVVLLSDQDLLVVLSEEGELALVKAAAGQFTELARVPAIEGKTWNHPVLAGDVLLVRNSEEMAAFRLTLAGR